MADSDTSRGIGGIIFAVCVVAVGVAVFMFRPVSAADKERYGKACEEWIGKEVNNSRPARVADAWRKRGNLVFEVLAFRENGASASVHLCVVDTENGNMLKPSAFDTSWR